ncbi:MAG: hypothetical protein JSV51_03010, partial [Candidatus Bathyarchaeota archaeon]
IDVAYGDLAAIQRLVDKTSFYTNLFVIGCTELTRNVTKLDEICQYLYDKDLSFIVYTERRFQNQWFEDAKVRWGKRFLGFYLWDENAGKQLDLVSYRAVREADNYTDAGNKFVESLSRGLIFMNYTDPAISLFTSDYALYWFDYKAGYDVVLAQFGWNYSRQLNLALCRGAATAQDKEWGVVITWTYTQPPYIGTGPELYRDMVLAYENGAKYIVVFDSDQNYTRGILEDDHLEALRRFWIYANNNPRTSEDLSERGAYVLPKDYGYGFRGPDDKIWGLWEADAFSLETSTILASKLEQYGNKLDIIYDDGITLNNTGVYAQFMFWNGTIYGR